mmetsp:Transcript_27623/g.58700  ORF Transcript_27623/g.58700 Transcript_27623/m.58700 type:complete len:219 (-) Transcript_27623:1243-1899(-)
MITASSTNPTGTQMVNPTAKNLTTASKLRSLRWNMPKTMIRTRKLWVKVAIRTTASPQSNPPIGCSSIVITTKAVISTNPRSMYRLRWLMAAQCCTHVRSAFSMNLLLTLLTSLAYSWNGWWVMMSMRCMLGGRSSRASLASCARAHTEKSWHQHWHRRPQQQLNMVIMVRDMKSPPLRFFLLAEVPAVLPERTVSSNVSSSSSSSSSLYFASCESTG